MSPQRKRAAQTPIRSEDEARDQEVVRATKELAAYFKGARTEREARAALKIIKAFIRNRERVAPAERRPLPGLAAPRAPSADGRHAARAEARKKRPRARRPAREAPATSPEPQIELPPIDQTQD